MEGRLVNDPRQVAVQEAVLHRRQFRLAFAEQLLLLALELMHVLERGAQGIAEPCNRVVRQPDGSEVLKQGLLNVRLAPTDDGMAVVGVVVAAAIVSVLVYATGSQFPAYEFAGHGKAAAGAPNKTAGKQVVWVARAAVAACQHVLAHLKGLRGNQHLVLPWVRPAVAHQLANVESVVQDVGKAGPVELRHTGAVDEPFGGQLVRQPLEGVPARGVQLEDAHERLRLLRMRLDRFLLVACIHVAEGGMAGRPALSDLLVHALQDFGAQVVGVVLRHGGHDVEGQCPRRPGAELVLHEGQLYPAGVLQFLEAHGVTHVAADAVKLVREDRLDLVTPRVGLDPPEHLVEGGAFRAAFGGLGHDELAHRRPAVLQRAVPRRPELRVYRIALLLLAGRHPRPDHHIHRLLLSFVPESSSASRPGV